MTPLLIITFPMLQLMTLHFSNHPSWFRNKKHIQAARILSLLLFMITVHGIRGENLCLVVGSINKILFIGNTCSKMQNTYLKMQTSTLNQVLLFGVDTLLFLNSLHKIILKKAPTIPRKILRTQYMKEIHLGKINIRLINQTTQFRRKYQESQVIQRKIFLRDLGKRMIPLFERFQSSKMIQK